jgi:hypothetical protein
MKKNVYLAISILGVILPLTQFVPWTNAHGFDLGLMISEMFANHIASGIAIDALLAALAIVLFIIFDMKQSRVKLWWIPVIGIFVSGISFALPFYLFLRERSTHIEQE